jgi:glycogen debranching enzyme
MGEGAQVEDEVVTLHENYYILATSSRTDDRTRVLKHDETFAVFDRFGDVQPVSLGEQGLYHNGTRYLSRLELRIGGRRPLLLSSTVKEENDLLTVDLTNVDISTPAGELLLPRGQIHVFRSKFLWQGACHERLFVSNFGLTTVTTEIMLEFGADYADIFEVRGTKRERRGRRLDDLVEGSTVMLGYEGLDRVVRRTRLVCSPAPHHLSGSRARFELVLPPRQAQTIYFTVACEEDRAARAVASNEDSFNALEEALRQSPLSCCQIRASDANLKDWLTRSLSDLEMMITETPHGPYPYAGVPWFSTPFGRDGIITALEILWMCPEVARGVLKFLAATQATENNPAQDAQPGKILHEARGGEMAALGEVPFGRYYGSVDATPLFVMLAGAYLQRTADLELIESIMPNIRLAIRWIEGDGDPDKDGFVEYARMTPNGLAQQGWKDSQDSVFHEDGTLAEGPIALCEVQGYVYAARRAAALIATARGRDEEAEHHLGKARSLQAEFEGRFWLEDLGTYALALDGRKRPCRVRTSNAGHALYTGIASRARARRTAETLMDDDGFSRWGVRTLASCEARYNPMSYHNGSVWPHDNALIAAGFARYGFRDQVVRVMEGMMGASLFVDLHRLPELFCGFRRRAGEGPTLYPVACAPQAWACGSVFMLLAAALGLTIDAQKKEISFAHPALPEGLGEIRITNLKVGDSSIDLHLEKYPHDVGVTVLRRDGDVRVSVVK